MYDVTKLVPIQVFNYLLNIVQTPKQLKRGRRRIKKELMLCGILQVLRLGIPWHQIFDCGCSYSSCYRYFSEIQRRGYLHLIFQELAKDKTNITECAIDSSTVTSFRFRNMTGWDGKHKKNGTKISLISDIDGLPRDVLFWKGNRHDNQFVPKHIKNTTGRRIKVLNLDKIYQSLEFRRNMRSKGVYVNMQTIAGYYIRKKGPKFKFKKDKYEVRFKIERLNG